MSRYLPYTPQRFTASRRFRVVAIRSPQTRNNHLHITDIAHEVVSAIGQLCGARWLIEILFRQLKSYQQLEGFPSLSSGAVLSSMSAILLHAVLRCAGTARDAS